MPIFGSCSGCCSDYPPSHSRHNLRLRPRPPNLGAAGFADLRLASISTFVDSRRGTQCAVAELLERLARTYHCDIHSFAQLAEDLEVAPPNSEHSAESGAILWHETP